MTCRACQNLKEADYKTKKERLFVCPKCRELRQMSSLEYKMAIALFNIPNTEYEQEVECEFNKRSRYDFLITRINGVDCDIVIECEGGTWKEGKDRGKYTRASGISKQMLKLNKIQLLTSHKVIRCGSDKPEATSAEATVALIIEGLGV